MKRMSKIAYLKLVTLISFVCITLGNIVAYNNPAKGYELSIYESTPFSIWVSLFFAMVMGLFIVTYNMKYKCPMYISFLGLLVLLTCRLSVQCLPYVRGYYTFNYDHVSHIGLIKDIINTGFFPDYVFYPITHILLSEITLVTNLHVLLVSNCTAAVVSLFYLVSLYLIANFCFDKNIAFLAITTATLVIFDEYSVLLMPNGLSMLFIPFFLFLFFKSKDSSKYPIVLLIIIFLYPFFHPFSSFIVIIYLFSANIIIFLCGLLLSSKPPLSGLLGKIYENIHRNTSFLQNTSLLDSLSLPKKSDYNFNFSATLVLLIIWILWILSFACFFPSIRRLFHSILFLDDSSALVEMGSKLDKVGLQGWDVLYLLMKDQGDTLIFLLFTFLSVYIFFKIKNRYNEPLIYVCLIVLTTITGLFYLSYLSGIIPGLSNFNASRLLVFIPLFTPIYVGHVFHTVLKKNNFLILSFCLIIVLASTVSGVGLYTSPYKLRPSLQVTQMDVDGGKWALNYKNIDVNYTYITTSPPRRIADYVIGHSERKSRKDFLYQGVKSQIPDHFNYSYYEKVGDSYDEDKYAVIHKLDRIVYSTVWKNVGRFSDTDFIYMERDSTVEKLYSNGECDVYYIHSNI